MHRLRYDASRGPLVRQDGSPDATMNTLRYSIAFVLGIALPLLVQRWDRRRRRRPLRRDAGWPARVWHTVNDATAMSAEQRAGAWNCASWGAALYGFGPISMLGWVWVAHHDWPRWRRAGLLPAIARSLALLAIGVLGVLLVSYVIVGVDALLAWALGLPE